MRSRVAVIVIIVGIAAVAAVLLRKEPPPPQPTQPQPAQQKGVLPAREITAGAVMVTITPLELDESGAVFSVALNTHSGSLDVDFADAATLEVGGKVWEGATWSGSPAGGHHRTGKLIYPGGGPVTGTATLRIEGLPGPVEATWEVPS